MSHRFKWMPDWCCRGNKLTFDCIVGLFSIVGLSAMTVGCDDPPASLSGDRVAQQDEDSPTRKKRTRMIEDQLVARNITDKRVLAAMGKIPRHRFVPSSLEAEAYEDSPLPIGFGQTISQPYIVALMTQILEPSPTDKVLEIGTGSGYQAAVLSELVADVYSIEIVKPLAERAKATFIQQAIGNVHVRAGDGYRGWPEEQPFDAIIVTCAPDKVPAALVDQLGDGGRMVIPVGRENGPQELYLLTKRDGKLERRAVLPVRFVPMTGAASPK